MATDESKPRDIENFRGTLSADGIKIGIRFGVEIDASGSLLLHFERMQANEELWRLYQFWAKEKQFVTHYTLEGTGENGSVFQTKHFIIASFGRNHDGKKGTTFHFSGTSSTAVLNRKIKERVELPVLRIFLKGFKCFSNIQTDCQFGAVVAAGSTEIANIENPSGYISIHCNEEPSDIGGWKSDAENLGEHIRRILSFAAGAYLQSPMIEFYHGDIVETIFYECRPQHKGTMAVLHFLHLGPIFESAIKYYFTPSVEVKNLHLAIEWFSMGASYTEIRLVNAMTALEMLIDSNLLADDKRFLSNGQFEKIRKVIRKELKDCIEIPIEQLNEKLADINRRSFRDKLTKLACRWAVPMDGITCEALEAAIKARNHVIHRGTYEHVRDSQNDLWDHFTLVREIVVRILLKSLGFEGEYISHYGRYHFAQFPPVIDNSEQP